MREGYDKKELQDHPKKCSLSRGNISCGTISFNLRKELMAKNYVASEIVLHSILAL